MWRLDWQTAVKVPLAMLPAGSGNALSANTGMWDLPTALHALIKASSAYERSALPLIMWDLPIALRSDQAKQCLLEQGAAPSKLAMREAWPQGVLLCLPAMACSIAGTGGFDMLTCLPNISRPCTARVLPTS